MPKRSGAPTSILIDGNNGIDNNFGGHVMQTIHTLKSSVEDDLNKSITDGKFTLSYSRTEPGVLRGEHVVTLALSLRLVVASVSKLRTSPSRELRMSSNDRSCDAA